MAMPVSARPQGGSVSPSLRVLTEFQFLVEDRPVLLPHSVERVLAFLGMNNAPVKRARIAGSLWPDIAESRANGGLRSALWRLRRVTGVIREQNHSLALSPDVNVDIADMTELTRALVTRPTRPALDRIPDLVGASAILPGWDDEWLVVERERYRIRRLRALEKSAEALLTAGDHAGALDAALASVDTEPYRETAHRLVIRVHIAEGNYAEAIRAYQSYCALVSDELGIPPSSRIDGLVAPLANLPAHGRSPRMTRR